MIELTSERIVIDRIKIDNKNQPFDDEVVLRLMGSIGRLGLLQPIMVCRPGMGLGVKLIFGRNRLEACRRLKHTAIPSRVVNGSSTEIEVWCKQAVEDENALRRGLPLAAPRLRRVV